VSEPAALPTVLLADDEVRLLRMMERLLADRGYPVVTARDGDEALRASEAHRGAIGVAVLDAHIAPAGAFEVLDALLAAQPRLGLVLTSGDLLEAPQRAALRGRGAILLPKPFPASGLLQAVADAARAATRAGERAPGAGPAE
jgi:CheY-like chemotaxis protein